VIPITKQFCSFNITQSIKYNFSINIEQDLPLLKCNTARNEHAYKSTKLRNNHSHSKLTNCKSESNIQTYQQPTDTTGLVKEFCFRKREIELREC